MCTTSHSTTKTNFRGRILKDENAVLDASVWLIMKGMIVNNTLGSFVTLLLIGMSLCFHFKATHVSESCSRKRHIFNDSWGIVSDGPGDYPQDSYCEWLIGGSKTGQVVNLKFHDMLTECSYDYLFIYNGDSYNSSILGSFSGNTLPSPIYANSGKMLILLFSDTNYVQKGFQAEFSVTDCPLNCSYHGRCELHKCICDDMWMGESCLIPRCPDECWELAGRGTCQRIPSPPTCVCNPGHSGQSCSLGLDDNTGNRWHMLANSGTGLTPRAGHAGIYLQFCDSFFVFGGFTLNEVLGDLVVYNFSTSKWRTLDVRHPRPSPRYGHAAAPIGDKFALFGGRLMSGKFSSELWLYDVKRNLWTVQLVPASGKPPGLARHTLTAVDDYLYLFGGNHEDGLFSSEMFRINLKEEVASPRWEKVYTLGGKEMDRRFVGHSTVYHADSRSLIVYGGIAVDVAKFSKLSERVHVFNVDTKYWSWINMNRGDTDFHVPLERAFHTSNIIGNYMVVFGGYTHLHSKEEICYDNRLYFYHLGCHVWVNVKEFENDFPGIASPVSQGSFSHVSAVRNGNVLLIAGGYSGAVRGDFLAYTVPANIASQNFVHVNMSIICKRHKTRESCRADPECGWCPGALGFSNDTCMDKTQSSNCKLRLDTGRCPTICPLLSDCQACLAIGGMENVKRHKSNFKSCRWCVQKAECYSEGNPTGICAFGSNRSYDVVGWWGINATNIKSLNECRYRDFRPGLTLLKFRHPPNWFQPDEVSIINSTTENIHFIPEFPGHREQDARGEYVTRFLGFIHPLGTKPKAEQHLRLFISTRLVKAVLRMSLNESEQFLEVVANHTSGSKLQRTESHRPGDKSLFSNPSRGHKYLIDFDVRLPISAEISYNDQATVQLVWNGFPNYRKEFTYEFLEPFSGGICSNYNNCLACLSDMSCGWCSLHSMCLQRIPDVHDSGIICADHRQSQYLVLQPKDCITCSDYIYCENCTAQPHCEWLIEDSHCVRRGRFADAVRDVIACPVPCNLYTNITLAILLRNTCSFCLGEPGRCAWCEHLQQCFLFSTYTTSYVYGMCREWVDEDHTIGQGLLMPGAQCRNCSIYTSCKDCLSDLRCGWCGNQYNPIIGSCSDGDFHGPSKEKCSSTKSSLHSYPETHVWFYDLCPDVEECLLGLHDCHPNATCTNTFDLYECTCNKGFRGDGHESCVKTCDEICVNGICSEVPFYQCNCYLGWTEVDCSANCGCNNHSTCLQGVGMCDECQDWTEGLFCERCKAGSYGNATKSQGCRKCNCNEHGSESDGYCDTVTGVCFCQDHTAGEHCEQCELGYYGDPRNGGNCFLKCGSRQLLTSIQKGGLGSQPGSSLGDSCLWILTVHPDLKQNLFLRDSATPSIHLTIQPDLNVKCSENFVYIFDGLPGFVLQDPHRDWQNKVLGVFCGSNINKSIEVEAKSGFLTVFYQRDDPMQGFNSTFRVETCSEKCPGNQLCIQGWCQCQKGFAGPNCSLRICPNHCSQLQWRGVCNEEYGVCLCEPGFTGIDCLQPMNQFKPTITTLFDPLRLAPSAEHLASILPRMGHTLISDHERNLWLFGGYSLSRGPLNDMYKFDTKTYKWEKVAINGRNANSVPRGRYFQASAFVWDKREIYIYGGLSQTEILDDFWKFNITSKKWTQLENTLQIPALAGHTLTLCGKDRMVLIGGFDIQYGFLDKFYEYDVNSAKWTMLNVSGATPTGLYGHTAVYSPRDYSIYVFGGILYRIDKTVVSNQLFAFHHPSKRWTVLPSEKGPFSLSNLRYRYMHSAVTMNEYMVIIGGRSKNGDLTDSILAYNYACNMWVELTGDGGHKLNKDDLEEAVGRAVVRQGNTVYIFGGFSGQLIGTLRKLYLPVDLCSVFATKHNCWQAPDCLFCSVYHINHTNQSFCYSSKRQMPLSCSNPDGTVELSSVTINCNKELLESRDCSQYATCSECLAVWPSYPNAKNVCQWFTTSQGSRCIAYDPTCEADSECNYIQLLQGIRDPENCPERTCTASDCEKCRNAKQCIWTRQILRSNEMGRTISTVNVKPIYDWNCFLKKIQTASNFPVVSMPPLACPPRCAQHRDCRSCLDSAGAEGGFHECRWSRELKECISPSYQPLRCVAGICGMVLRGSSEQCPRNCSEFNQCSHCLSQPQCGWCALSGSDLDGHGLCMEGGLDGPSTGICRSNNVSFHGEILMIENSPQWSYMKCPAENECLNNHHTCDKKSEDCIDLVKGFECRCRKGYINEGKVCKPICHQGCLHGTCVSPEECECYFGYVSKNCSIQCNCNGHSMCESVDQLDSCLDCKNNTQGKQCDKCKVLFIGNPRNNDKCISCNDYCNGHAKVCVEEEYYNITAQILASEAAEFSNLTDLLSIHEGASAEAVCVLCRNNTRGNRCELCQPGFFRTTENNPQEACRPCECQGHGNSCDPYTGEKCNCQNNTETDQHCNQKSKTVLPCWMQQCSKCKDSFLGTPTNGHQCYRQMTVDRDYCFDPLTQDSCLKPYPLHSGYTVYFVVYPKFRNVDIRVIVDVIQGSLDLYLSPRDDTFVIRNNLLMTKHVISVDAKYGIELGFSTSPQNNETFHVERKKRSSNNFKYNDFTTFASNPNNSDATEKRYKFREKSAKGLNTFVTIADPFEFLVVRNIENRLVITLPQEVHDLRSTHFYLVLQSTSTVNKDEVNVTYGNLFFRQDQPRIDLFVFFQFSFPVFPFLAVCVIVWKVKQAVEVRRARQRQAVEMEHMASRPFARITAIIDEEIVDDFLPYSPTLYAKKWKGRKHFHGRDSPKIHQNDDKYSVRPVAIEPTDDSVSAVSTLLIQLPGGSAAPVKLTLGSALVTMRVYPTTYSSIKACMRRRTSYHNT
uniref:Multiple epidermal growth factor-like domains protein 8 n=1 Tax=Strigamia maritima TaxID=126957 RepID=T1JFI7_STRMM